MPEARILICEPDFESGQEIRALRERCNNEAGGLGAFIGVVRGNDGLESLTLEHYPGMTERIVNELAQKAISRFSLTGCTIIHRTGTMKPGEQIVLVLTAAAHRDNALDSVQFLIDHLKTSAPFWKKERFADGREHWINARQSDDLSATRWEIS